MVFLKKKSQKVGEDLFPWHFISEEERESRGELGKNEMIVLINGGYNI
jgi:hypothetical protein